MSVVTNPAPTAAQLEAWRRLWSLLLTKPGQQEVAGNQPAARVEVRRAGVEQPPR
jgi:hypothetical protein